MRVSHFFILSSLMGVALVFNGCTTVATSGASAIYNHQSIQKSVSDQYISMRAYQAIDVDSDHFRNANINIATFNKIVLLSGQAPSTEQKFEAEQIVKKIANKAKVYNFITVETPSSQLTRLNDAWLTTKIKAKLLVSSDLDATQVKVVTENGTVFLVGMVRPKEAQVAVNTASHTAGVREVVKIFAYLNLSNTPAEDG